MRYKRRLHPRDIIDSWVYNSLSYMDQKDYEAYNESEEEGFDLAQGSTMNNIISNIDLGSDDTPAIESSSDFDFGGGDFGGGGASGEF